MSKKFRLIVLTRPVAGREKEYLDWYQNTHLRQVVEVPGFVSAQFFKLAVNMVESNPTYPYCAMYEVETDDFPTAMAELRSRAGTDSMIMSEALDLGHAYIAGYEEMGPVVKKK